MINQKPKIFDFITIFLIVVLTGLILVVGGMIVWKEKNIKTEFKIFSKTGISEGHQSVTRGDKIVISFSGPVQTESIASNLNVEPKINFKTDWKNNHQLEIVIEDNLVPDFNYELVLKEFRSKWGFLNKKVAVDFSTDPLPILKNVTPENDSKEVKINQEIVFEFEDSLPSQYFLKIKTEPEFEFESIEVENKIVIKPIVNFAFDTEYKIFTEVQSKDYFDFSRKISEISFKTERPPVVVYGWDNDGTPTKTEIRTELQEPSIGTGRYIDIDLTKQNLYIFENGREIGAYKVSSGIRGMNTPAGEFKVIARSRRPWSQKYGLFMPWFIQFTYEGHGIHELPEWPGGYKEGANHLGIPVSHGCVRLGIGPAKKVYDFVETGTPIVIHY